MEVIRRAIIKRHRRHPLLDTIIRDITAILKRTDEAWEAGDRVAFTTACRELKQYQPPAPK